MQHHAEEEKHFRGKSRWNAESVRDMRMESPMG